MILDLKLEDISPLEMLEEIGTANKHVINSLHDADTFIKDKKELFVGEESNLFALAIELENEKHQIIVLD